MTVNIPNIGWPGVFLIVFIVIAWRHQWFSKPAKRSAPKRKLIKSAKPSQSRQKKIKYYSPTGKLVKLPADEYKPNSISDTTK